MKYKGLNEIRESFLKFFESKDHLRLPSFSLIPKNDTSLLLINAGMAPLKPYFTGKEKPPSKRVVTCQKCIRTPDIERVGKTARHGTFFEMLGNFSFGDYFKKEAVSWAWEYVTKELGLPVEKLWVSVYEEDDEAFSIWHKDIGLGENRIVRLSKEDNFWEIGTGPCGPCSEIYYDRGEDKGCGSENCMPGCDCDRFIEFWNLVFTQYDKDENGTYHKLANPNIDTGMGLERIAAIIQNVDSLFEVDTIKNIMKHVSEIAGVQYNEDEKKDISLRVITDHIRGTVFMTSDGILPSNEGRGYVLRRLLRRAARHGKLLGIKDKFLYNLAQTVINESADAYPELCEKKDYIMEVIKKEEERFDETIDQGLNILNSYIDELKEAKANILSADKAFRLYDTFGFPIDLTKEILSEQGITVDEEGFNEEMNKQREKARNARNSSETEGWKEGILHKIAKSFKTDFLGYETCSTTGKILAIVQDNKELEIADEEMEVNVIVDKTPFYGESGGQVGDTGIISTEGAQLRVNDCKKIEGDVIVHVCKVEKGNITKNQTVNLTIDNDKRQSTARNHTATHLLHRALKNVLGEHVSQAGSSVHPERLRFDFSHYQPLTTKEIKVVEDEINRIIMKNICLEIIETDREGANLLGATALFGEKYGDIVRVVKIGDYSIELCGGTHTLFTGQIGLFKILSETGVAAGVRRIEAITGKYALDYYKEKENTVNRIGEILKTQPDNIINKVSSLIEELRQLQKENESIKMKLAGESADNILKTAQDINGVKVITARMDNLDMNGLRNMGDMLRNKVETGLVVLASAKDEKVSLVAMATKSAVEKGINSGKIIGEIAKIVEGGGGGRPDVAQAGGKDISKIDEALKAVGDIVGRL